MIFLPLSKSLKVSGSIPSILPFQIKFPFLPIIKVAGMNSTP